MKLIRCNNCMNLLSEDINECPICKSDSYLNDDFLDVFTRAYIECALWSSFDDERPLDENYNINDISESCLTAMIADCAKFQAENMPMIIDNLSQAGHDFWLTRNHHGAGFWDGDWPENGDILTTKSQEFKECDLYVGDDDLIYC